MRTDIIKYRRIRDLRMDRDLTQSDIAQYLSIKQNTYSRYETDERSMPLEVMDKLADYYGTSIDYLVGRTDEKTPYPKAKAYRTAKL